MRVGDGTTTVHPASISSYGGVIGKLFPAGKTLGGEVLKKLAVVSVHSRGSLIFGRRKPRGARLFNFLLSPTGFCCVL